MTQFIEELHKKRRILLIRFAVSALFFLVFLALTISSGNMLVENKDTLAAVLCVVVGAVFVLPRRASPARWPKARNPEEDFELNSLRVVFRRLDLACTRVRIGYYVLGALVIWLFVLR